MSDKNVKWNDICNRTDSCALCGAAAWAAGIEKTQILVNGPLWCYFYAMRLLEYNDVGLAERMHMTQLDNTAIVYGSENAIREGIDRILETGNPELLFVENNCSAGLIGDDLLGMVRSFNLGIPCVAMDSGGTIGCFAEGFSKACIKTLELFLDAKKSANINPIKINLLGMTPYYYNGKADMEELARILRIAGYEVNCLDSVSAIKSVREAALNIVCHEELGLEIAGYLQSEYAMNYICPGLPYGCYGTREWIKAIHKSLPAPNLEAVLNEIDKMEFYLTKKNSEIATLWNPLAFDKVFMAGTGTVVQCMADALRKEWLDTDELVIISQHKLKKQYCSLVDRIVYADDGNYTVAKLFASEKDESCLLLGSSNEYMEVRMESNKFIPRIHISLPAVDGALLNQVPYMGIKGSANMLQHLWNCFIEMKLQG